MMMIHMPARSATSPFRKMQPFPVVEASSHSACGSQVRHQEGEISGPRPTNERLDSPAYPSVSTSAWRISEREMIPLTTSCSSTTTSLCTWGTNGRHDWRGSTSGAQTPQQRPFLASGFSLFPRWRCRFRHSSFCEGGGSVTSASTSLLMMVSRVSSLLHVSTPSKYWERCCKALVTVTSRLLYVFSAARFWANESL